MKRLKLLGVAVTVALSIAACSGSDTNSDSSLQYNPAGNVLNIVAGSEQEAVFDKIVQPWCNQQNLECKLTKMGSVDQARLLQGDVSQLPYDAFWFASKVFQQLGDSKHALQDVQPMFSTPIVYAGWKSEMDRLGFTGREVKIEEVLTAVESDKTKVWMTNPTQSNSGATVFFGFLNHFADNEPGVALTQAQLDSPSVQSGITRFARSFDHTPPSTGTLMDECVANPGECKTLFTYEALVIETNKRLVAEGKEPLYAVYPKGSLAISDSPLGFLPHGANDEKRRNFQALQAYVLSPEAQNKLVAEGRRPITSIGLSLPNAPTETFNAAWGIRPMLEEQPITYPATAVIQTGLDNYHTIYRKPVDIYYCIDGSGSMVDNGGWNGVRSAASLLFDPAESAKYLLQLNPQDRTVVDIFSDGQRLLQRVDGNNSDQLRGLKDKILDASPGGGTGIYRCLGRAADHFKATPAEGRKQLVVMMTDGADTEGGSELVDQLTGLKIPVVTIGFGSDISEGSLREIASKTRGAYIGSKDLVDALRQATGYK